MDPKNHCISGIFFVQKNNKSGRPSYCASTENFSFLKKIDIFFFCGIFWHERTFKIQARSTFTERIIRSTHDLRIIANQIKIAKVRRISKVKTLTNFWKPLNSNRPYDQKNMAVLLNNWKAHNMLIPSDCPLLKPLCDLTIIIQ